MQLNTIYNENCLDTMGKMPDGFIDLVVTSPPYDNLRKYKGYSFQFEEIAKELYRTLKEGGVLVWVVGDSTTNGTESLTSFKQAIYFVEQCGFNLHDTMIYKKKNYVTLNHNRYEQEFEFMFCFSKGKPKTFNPIMDECKTAGRKNPKGTYRSNGTHETSSAHTQQDIKANKIAGNVFEYDTGFMRTTKDKFAFKHPAMFPEGIANDQILTWSNEGELVYDPFAGSGTTLKIAKQLNRKYICSEISKEYSEIAEQRVTFLF